MKVDVILGLQWGDEGKGKIVDVLSPRYDIIARFQGGPNAGHTLEFNGKKMVLHTIPSGIFHEGKKNVIGNGVVIDPVVFSHELADVETLHPSARQGLYISKRAHLITPHHRILDAAYEHSKGEKKIGSTLKGISPAYTDKYARNGLRVGDLLQENFQEIYRNIGSQHLETLNKLGYSTTDFTIEGMSFHDFEQKWLEEAKSLAKLQLIDSEVFLNDALKNNASILAEGAQGTLLDVDFGSYPFVTSSNTSTGGVCTGLGIAPRHIGKVYGIFKAYCTRVGSGPFPTELDDETGNRLRTEGSEFGATTGRPRRCGWLDLVALNYAIMINGVEELIMTKGDVLDKFTQIKVCEAYDIDGKTFLYPPYENQPAKFSPALRSLDGWETDISRLTKVEDLPEPMKQYIRLIENFVHTPVRMISTGPDRKQIIET